MPVHAVTRRNLSETKPVERKIEMLKQYTKYAATAFAVASLSTFMIGCAEEEAESTEEQPSAPEENKEIPSDEIPSDGGE